MADKRFITLAIHTYDRAVALRKILESHGIGVKFESLVLTGTHIASGVRVKINERDLPLALKLTESGDYYSSARVEMRMTGASGNILIPVDFSAYSIPACRIGFELAARLQLHPVVMNAYATPYFMGGMVYDGNLDSDGVDDVAEMEIDKDMRSESEKLMREFRKKIEKEQKEGSIPDVRFSTLTNEGIPEEVILEYCRLTPPALVVMATRGKSRKEEDLVGSVTAEVMDSCRVPVFAFPENAELISLDAIKRVAYFCNLDQRDIISVDTLMRLFEYPAIEMTVIPVNDRAGNIKDKVEALRDFFSKNYPTGHFKSQIFQAKTFREEFDEYVRKEHIQLVIVPNKKKNIFSRLFNPGIPHKILFERDMPILALPV